MLICGFAEVYEVIVETQSQGITKAPAGQWTNPRVLSPQSLHQATQWHSAVLKVKTLKRKKKKGVHVGSFVGTRRKN